MEASIKHLVDSDLRHERVSASSPQAAVGLRAVNASCWPSAVACASRGVGARRSEARVRVRRIAAAQYRAGLMSLPKVQLPFATNPGDPDAV